MAAPPLSIFYAVVADLVENEIQERSLDDVSLPSIASHRSEAGYAEAGQRRSARSQRETPGSDCQKKPVPARS
jgi:hypothetical protein